jgi:GNAT superfamily N-acetyltransferase
VRESGMRGHLALVHEVIDGRMGGKIFVDDLRSPHTAVVCNSNGFNFAFGQPDAPGLSSTVDWLVSRNTGGVALFGSNPEWDAALAALMIPIGAEPTTRLAFELIGIPSAPPLPDGFQLEPINRIIASRILDGTGTGGYGIDPWFIRIAGGARAYAALDLGFALTRGDQIASICGVCGLGGGEVELEVGTVPAFRGQGLAVIVSAAFMEQCRTRGLLPAYSCTEGNIASKRVAHRLGFTEMERIHGYNLPYDQP